MKLFHLSDLHLGKRVNEFSMLEDQADILTKILRLADEEAPDGILIAGDIYDKSVPSAEAVELLDDFLYRLSLRGTQVFLISGNHDSPERLGLRRTADERERRPFCPGLRRRGHALFPARRVRSGGSLSPSLYQARKRPPLFPRSDNRILYRRAPRRDRRHAARSERAEPACDPPIRHRRAPVRIGGAVGGRRG